MGRLFFVLYLVVTWNTLRFGRIVWKQGKRFSSVIVVSIALILVGLATWVFLLGPR